MGIGGARGGTTPLRPLYPSKIVREKSMNRTERFPHALKHLRSLLHRNSSERTLQGDPDKTDLRNGRCEQPRAASRFALHDPTHDPVMIRMITPAPCHQNIDVQKVSHRAQGKSASIFRVESTVSGGRSSAPSKMVAPVSPHGESPTSAGIWEEPTACLRRNSDTVRRSILARARIFRASSSLTLKEIVAMVLPYYRRRPLSKSGGVPL